MKELEPGVQATLDQISSSLRDLYDKHLIDLHDDKIRVAIVMTANLLMDAKITSDGVFHWTLRGLIQLMEAP
jgi:hypothetical protein